MRPLKMTYPVFDVPMKTADNILPTALHIIVSRVFCTIIDEHLLNIVKLVAFLLRDRNALFIRTLGDYQNHDKLSL